MSGLAPAKVTNVWQEEVLETYRKIADGRLEHSTTTSYYGADGQALPVSPEGFEGTEMRSSEKRIGAPREMEKLRGKYLREQLVAYLTKHKMFNELSKLSTKESKF